MARILLVDDEATVRELIELVLQLDAHEVTLAGDGDQAIQAMPGKEGIETIMEIRQLRPELRIIAMSGGGRGNAGDYLAMAAQLGAARTLEKPFTNDALLTVVREVLAA
jgi:CheY-like chemotaxis protein